MCPDDLLDFRTAEMCNGALASEPSWSRGPPSASSTWQAVASRQPIFSPVHVTWHSADKVITARSPDADPLPPEDRRRSVPGNIPANGPNQHAAGNLQRLLKDRDLDPMFQAGFEAGFPLMAYPQSR
jgi:hypothetical protein